jgi:hypothetical protein
MTPAEIAADLERRGCSLKHAINLPDLRSYAAHQALLSRAQLVRTGGIQTPFASDESDERRGIFERCFGNLSDFGQSFWRFDHASPNPYGPITLVFRPETFKLCVDLAVTRKNAGNASYDLSTDRITDAAAWRGLFREPDSSRLATGAFFVEVSTSTNTIPFALLDKVIVEPISVGGRSLAQAVHDLLGIAPTERDPAPPGKKQVLDQLVALCAHRGGTPPHDDDLTPAPDEAKTWWNGAETVQRRVAFRWFEYVVSTLRDLSPASVRDPVAREDAREDAGEQPAGEYECDYCGTATDTVCSGCKRPLCDDDYFGAHPDQRHDAEAQRRCWECAYDPT